MYRLSARPRRGLQSVLEPVRRAQRASHRQMQWSVQRRRLARAFDAAIQDGVDNISVSLGGGAGSVDYFSDSSAIGAFHAVAKGITVACSAGNSGPFLLGVVNNAAPWVITVAAITIDRDFKQTITSTNNKQIQGRSFTLKIS
ncbi:hypothetical protein C4D60_Mb01t22150 [Musa balbisiana]|uniref:Peptidase S8/S53 domain-containing protein n=1 Tax=Musa balbisiana TaxID=52838 RepID=A0A4S8JP91_MUSBA|nr:hypothetical protein C4D60_Mb01t22150 [Musa balbisiana]